ncbi:MAG: hypothetical protein KDE00_04790 [Rhodobacteraceae bacterium]|nr:hypothetical protein [Paracoccaceae bacterium]
MRNDAADALESLCRLVADERGALRAGDLASLPAIASAKEALLSRLTSSPEALDLRRLARLKAEAQGLGHILQAAARGVAAARARIEAVRGAADRLDTYDARGRALNVAAGPSTVERRA